ncbi:MAG: lytic transglycosylase domain-containing protein [Thermotogaceae bacterium]|nr:lytic transglycosylase domain-containing protein [Thermotogaceae bacterium]
MKLLVATLLFFLVVLILYKAVNLFPLKYYDTINNVAKDNGLDALLIMAFIKVESGFKEDAVSPIGAKGLMQVMEDTARWLSKKTKRKIDITTPASNIEAGVLYLKYLIKRYSNLEKAIKAYNIGPNAYDSLRNLEAAERYHRKIKLSYLIYRILYRPPK